MATMYFRWNNQGAAHSGFHEMWLLMHDGWHHFYNDGKDSVWFDEGPDQEFNPSDLDDSWASY